MKVGGNESATKYFKSHGGSAALASKDPKTKYTSNAAKKYKEELVRRAAADTAQCVYQISAPHLGFYISDSSIDSQTKWSSPTYQRAPPAEPTLL